MIWVPRGLAGCNKLHLGVGKERAKIFGALLHAGFLRDSVAEKDQSCVAPLGTGVAHVLDGFPLGHFAREENFYVVRPQCDDLLLGSGGSGEKSHVGNSEVGSSDNTERRGIQFSCQFAGQIKEGRAWNRQLPWTAGIHVVQPAHGLDECDSNGVRNDLVHLVVKTEYDHVMLLNERQLLAVHRIVGEESGVVEMVVESGLMRDYEIEATALRLA